MEIKSIDKTVDELLASNYYCIPRFQRPYSWDQENIMDFWNDSIADRKSNDDYFIGSMVVFPGNNGYLNVVDGQQRLTSIIMLLCALRNVFEEESFNEYALGTQNIIEKVNNKNQKQFVLKTETSYPYFQENILKYKSSGEPISVKPEEINIKNAYELLTKLIRDSIVAVKGTPSMGAERCKSEIEKLLTSIRDKILSLKLIFIKLKQEDDAYIIFETLNTRGKDLTISDLLRNFITKNIRPETTDVDSAKMTWEKIKDVINGSSAEIDVDTYIHHYWLSKYSYLPSKMLFKEIRLVIKGPEVQAFLDDLYLNADYYRQIHETGYIKWSQEEGAIKASLNALQVFKVKQQVPLILSVLRSYRAKSLKIKNVQDIFTAIENFHFIFTAVTSTRSSGGISAMYVKAAIDVDNAKTSEEKVRLLRDFKAKLRERIPSIDEFRIAFNEIYYTESMTKQKQIVKYILTKYHINYFNALPIDKEKTTIEHLASQRLISDGLPEQVCGKLGNLILVTKEANSEQLKSKSFKDKVKMLKKSKYPLDEYLEKTKIWNGETIGERTNIMADEAYNNIWKIS